MLGGMYTENGTYAGVGGYRLNFKHDSIRWTGALGRVDANLEMNQFSILIQLINMYRSILIIILLQTLLFKDLILDYLIVISSLEECMDTLKIKLKITKILG